MELSAAMITTERERGETQRERDFERSSFPRGGKSFPLGKEKAQRNCVTTRALSPFSLGWESHFPTNLEPLLSGLDPLVRTWALGGPLDQSCV